MLLLPPHPFVVRLLSRWRAARRPSSRPRRHRLELELLEDRLVLDGTGVPPPPPPPPPPSPSPNGPVAVNDNWGYMTDSPTPVLVLLNDTDPNPGATLDPSTVTIITPPQHGLALPDPTTGAVLYTPNYLLPPGLPPGQAPPAVTDSFTYTVRDSLGLVSNVATVRVNPVSPVGIGPIVPQPDFANTVTLQPTSVNVIQNDQVNDGSAADPHSVTVVTPPAHGSAVVNPNTGVITYTPDFGFVGFDTITYSVKTTAGGGPGSTYVDFAVYPEAPRVQPDPLGGTMLVVDGTANNDVIRFDRGHKDGSVMVTINGVTSGPFYPTSRIVAFGYAGDDQITASARIKMPVWIDGGSGNDFIGGGGGPNLLMGGSGNDILIGGNNRDVLIGGTGQDILLGRGGDDILISGSTSFDSNQTALAAIMSEWTSHDSYAVRVGDLTGVTGPSFSNRLNGNVFLVPATIQSDSGGNVLAGGGGRNLYFTSNSTGTPDLVIDHSHHDHDGDRLERLLDFGDWDDGDHGS
jgi:hypothetical protein